MCSKVTMNVKPFNRSEKFVILQIGRVLSPRVSCESTEIQIHAILNEELQHYSSFAKQIKVSYISYYSLLETRRPNSKNCYKEHIFKSSTSYRCGFLKLQR